MRKYALAWGALVLSGSLWLAGCSHEAADWKSATAADTSEAYQQFLTQHPNSANAAQAHSRIAQLSEQRDWQVATAADTRDAYEQFLALHPDSQWAQEAHIRIENFAQGAGAASASAGAAVAASKASAAAASASTPAPSASSAHYVQLGAFSSRAHAEAQWKLLSTQYSRELGTLTPRYLAGQSNGRSVVRLQVAVGSRTQGRSLCAKLKSHARSCVPVGAG